MKSTHNSFHVFLKFQFQKSEDKSVTDFWVNGQQELPLLSKQQGKILFVRLKVGYENVNQKPKV